MIRVHYQPWIAGAKDGEELNRIRLMLRRDDAVNEAEAKALEAAIDKRFCELNAAAVGPQKARWAR